MQLRLELPELFLQMVAGDERVTISKDLALHEVTISGQEPPMFCQNMRGQRFIGNGLFVGCVVSEHPEPASQPAEHDIGEESQWLNDRRIERLHRLLYPARVMSFREHRYVL